MNDVVLVSLLSLLGTMLGSIAGILTSSKLTNYRIEQLEKTVEKQSSIVERTAILERDIKTCFRLIDERKGG